MTAHVIAIVNVTDVGQHEECLRLAGTTTQKTGGRLLTRSGEFVAVECEISAHRSVVVEYPYLDTAKRFYDCSEYRTGRAAREHVATFTLVGVGGA